MGRHLGAYEFDLAVDSISGEILAVQPSKDLTGSEGYELVRVAKFSDEGLAAACAEFLNQRISGDCAAFAVLQSRLRNELRQRCAALPSRADLEETVSRKKAEFHRTCFGQCRSLAGERVCAICYRSARDVWDSCAVTVTIWELLDDLEHYTECASM